MDECVGLTEGGRTEFQGRMLKLKLGEFAMMVMLLRGF